MASAGDEVALHGLTHRDNGSPRGWIDRLIRRHYTASEGEFSSLSSLQAARRLSAGARWMRSLALPLDGFIAPAWLLSDGAWQALRASPFSYTCTLRSIQVLPRGPVLRAQSQVFSSRSGWRRLASILWNVGLAAGQRRQPVVRLELHPVDAEHAAIRACWRWLLKWQLRTREATTLSRVALRLGGSEQQQHEFGGGQSDERACRHVTRIVKTEHDA
jgi:predicted deacetylase